MATKDKQFNIRCSEQFKQTLDLLGSHEKGYYFGWSQSEILHDLVKNAGKYCLPSTTWYLEVVNEI